MSSRTTISAFETLPGELVSQITNSLDLEAALQLRQTNRYFYSIIDLSGKPASTDLIAKFKGRNPKLDGPRLANHFACHMCRYLKPSTKKARRWTVAFVREGWIGNRCVWKWRVMNSRRSVGERHFRVCDQCLTKIGIDDRDKSRPKAFEKDITKFMQ